MASITKYELMSYLKGGGFIEKIAAQEAGSEFYCGTKLCTKVLDKDFEDFGIPTSRYVLREKLRKYSTGTKGNVYGPAPDLTTRCLICAYRGYRVLYKKKFGSFPDDDVPDNFNTNSEAPEPVKKVVSPKKTPQYVPHKYDYAGSQQKPQEDDYANPSRELSNLYMNMMMPLVGNKKYANILPMMWLAKMIQFTSKDFGYMFTNVSVVDLDGPRIWYLPSEQAWSTFQKKHPEIVKDNQKYQDIIWGHYLKPDPMDPRYLVNAIQTGTLAPNYPIRIKKSDIHETGPVAGGPNASYPIYLGGGRSGTVKIHVESIDHVLLPNGIDQPNAPKFDQFRTETITTAIRSMRELGANHWASLWELMLKSNKLQDQHTFPKHPVFVVPIEEGIQRFIKNVFKDATFALKPAPTKVGWDIFMCNFGEFNEDMDEFRSVNGNRYRVTDPGSLQNMKIDGLTVLDSKTTRIGNSMVEIFLIKGLLSTDELTQRARRPAQ